jgi:hypothetical protein
LWWKWCRKVWFVDAVRSWIKLFFFLKPVSLFNAQSFYIDLNLQECQSFTLREFGKYFLGRKLQRDEKYMLFGASCYSCWTVQNVPSHTSRVSVCISAGWLSISTAEVTKFCVKASTLLFSLWMSKTHTWKGSFQKRSPHIFGIFTSFLFHIPFAWREWGEKCQFAIECRYTWCV